MKPTMPSPSLGHRPSLLPIPPGQGRRDGAPRGFTLVELLVVIFIIALLMGLLTPVVMRSFRKARNAAIKTEADILHMAIMNYRNEYGGFPPAFDYVPLGVPPAQRTKTDLAAKHIRRLFPRATALPPKAMFTEDKNQNGSKDPSEDANGNNVLDGLFLTIPLQPENAMAFWLSGYSDDPLLPTSGALKPLYDLEKSRMETTSNYFTGRYHSPQMPTNGFYRYLDHPNYYFTYQGNTFPTPGVEFDPKTAAMAVGEDCYKTNGTIDTDPTTGFTEDANGNGRLDRGLPFNPDTFQIVHPGRDGVFGTEDDLSNCWPGTRQEYLESLR